MLASPNHAGSLGIKPTDVAEANFRKVDSEFQNRGLPEDQSFSCLATAIEHGS